MAHSGLVAVSSAVGPFRIVVSIVAASPGIVVVSAVVGPHGVVVSIVVA
ncbi:MAG: hypothetical protein KKC46_15250 [Proteobacteria bacterium]|nr:hypothetical protein [Pseudomonadota bacterium]